MSVEDLSFGLPAIAASLSPGPALSHSRSGFTRYAIAAAVRKTPPEQSVSLDELVVERGKHVQNDEAAKEHGKKDVCDEGGISHQGGR